MRKLHLIFISMEYEPRLLPSYKYEYTHTGEHRDIVDGNYRAAYEFQLNYNTFEYTSSFIIRLGDRRIDIAFNLESYKPYTMFCFGI